MLTRVRQVVKRNLRRIRARLVNVIKELQLDLFGERLPCAGFAANKVRLLLASFAHLLIER
jgi:hypothetical protein